MERPYSLVVGHGVCVWTHRRVPADLRIKGGHVVPGVVLLAGSLEEDDPLYKVGRVLVMEFEVALQSSPRDKLIFHASYQVALDRFETAIRREGVEVMEFEVALPKTS